MKKLFIISLAVLLCVPLAIPFVSSAEDGGVTMEKCDAFDFLGELEQIGVKTVICTDISKDGAMQGTNRELYKLMRKSLNIDIIASGGVTNLDDIAHLKNLSLYGAIIGRAYYTGAIILSEALEVAK